MMKTPVIKCIEPEFFNRYITALKSGLTKLYKMSVDFIESFEQGVKILFTSILQILYAGYRIQKDKKSFSRLVERLLRNCSN